MPRNYRELKVWQKAVDFAVAIYVITDSFPKTELYGLVAQIRRSAVSIASNIAEGSERQSDKEFIRYLNIAKGSLAEVETQILIAQKLNYLNQEQLLLLSHDANEIGKMLNGLRNKLEASYLVTSD